MKFLGSTVNKFPYSLAFYKCVNSIGKQNYQVRDDILFCEVGIVQEMNERYICFESNRFMGYIRDYVIFLKFNTWIRQKKYKYGLTISRKMSDKDKVKFAPCFVCP